MKISNSISFGIVRVEGEFFLQMQIKGKLAHQDYERMIPMIENALVGIKEPKIKVLVDAREFDGFELRAAWDDLKFGLKHNREFTKLAFVGSKAWESYGIKISNWFMSGKMRYFEDLGDAIEWLNEKDPKKVDLDTIEKEFKNREDEIKKELRFLFNANMRISGWDIPEQDSKKVAQNLLSILEDGIKEIKDDIDDGKFN